MRYENQLGRSLNHNEWSHQELKIVSDLFKQGRSDRTIASHLKRRNPRDVKELLIQQALERKEKRLEKRSKGLKRRSEKQLVEDYMNTFNKFEPFEIVNETLSPYIFETLKEYDFKLLLDCEKPKTFDTWQEKLADMAENADPETLEKSALFARRLLETSSIRENPTKREKLFRDHLQMLSEYAK